MNYNYNLKTQDTTRNNDDYVLVSKDLMEFNNSLNKTMIIKMRLINN